MDQHTEPDTWTRASQPRTRVCQCQAPLVIGSRGNNASEDD